MKIEFQSIGILIKLYYNYYITIREEYYRTFKFYLATKTVIILITVCGE